jgi:hypothetical protein
MRVLFLTLFTIFGLVLFGVGAQQYLQQRRLTAHPQRVPATITRSEVVPITSSEQGSRSRVKAYRPEVRFSYVVAGNTYESELLRPTIIGADFASHEEAAAQLAPFPKGASVSAYVNPSLPDKAYLVRETTSGPLVFMLVGLGVPPLTWLVLRFAHRKRPPRSAPGASAAAPTFRPVIGPAGFASVATLTTNDRE